MKSAAPTAAPLSPAPLPTDIDAMINEQVKRGRLLALGNLEAATAYRTAETTEQALTLLKARNPAAGESAPLVICVVSQDSRDVQRLETLLVAYADQAELRKKETQIADAKTAERAQVASAAPPTVQPQIAMGGRGGGRGGAGGGGAGGGAGGFGGGGFAGAARSAQPAAPGGARPTDAIAQQDVPNRTAIPTAPGAGAAAGPGASSTGQAQQQPEIVKQQQDRRVLTMPAPDTYHVLLRPDQLDQISQAFAISSIARGANAYSVTNSLTRAREQAATQQLSQGNPLPNGVVLNNGGSGNINGKNGDNYNQLQYNNRNDSNNNFNRDNTQGGNNTLNSAGMTEAASAPSTFDKALARNQAGNDQAKDADLPWIDCIITIVPPPVPTQK